MAHPGPTADELLAHTDWLMGLARALVGDAHAADIVQETYAVALTKPPRRDGPLRPWLGGVARNIAKMATRGRVRREQRDAQTASPAEAPTPEELVARVQTQQRVARIVLELAEPLRSTVLLRFFEGMTAAEIARAQGIPAATVRSRLADALARVRATLDEEHGGDRRKWVLLMTPLPGLGVGGAATTFAGGLLVKTGVKVLVALVLAVVVAFGTRWLGWWGGGDGEPAGAVATKPTSPGVGSAKAAGAAVTPAAAPASGWQSPVIFDDDPRGTLRLEGQVIDEHEAPVANARVGINANPPIVVQTEGDGSFVFEGLIPRDYRLEATAGDGYAGPARLRLDARSEPVTLRMRRGATIEVAVTEKLGGAAIQGAEVELRSTLTWRATTDAEGIARLRGVGPAWAPLVAEARGFAPAATMLGTSGNPANAQRVALALARGAAITGRVVNERGKPVGGAHVVAASASQPFPVFDPRRDGVVAGPDGKFTIPAVAAGTWRLSASHGAQGAASSAPITVDGVQTRGGIELVLVAGGVVRGIVKDAAGLPVAAAEVRVVSRGHVHWRARRQAFSDDEGRFAIAGLPRREVDVVASHVTGASAIVAADLAARREHDLALTLDISGTIAGTVVDHAGAPIGDAQVIAEPEWTGGVADRAAWGVRGIQEAVADQGGAFRFAGLPEGSYRVRATRSGASQAALSLAPVVVARPDGPPIKIVVPAEGRVVGKVAFADGKTPAAFQVSLGDMYPVAFASRDGTFSLAVAGGTHDLTVTGLGFVEKWTPDITITEGKDTDVGTIIVAPGRSISGRVLDQNGTPVAGAQVAAGTLLSGGGAELYIPSESIGDKDTKTDESGRFVLHGFPPAALAIVAGKDGLGRSPSIRIPPSPDSSTVDLFLAPTSGLEGTITRGGAPLADTIVIANSVEASSSNFFVTTGPDGTFALDALAPGAYTIYPMLGGGGGRPKDMYLRGAEVVLGKRTKIAIDATPGPATVTITVKTDRGDPIALAAIFGIQMELDVTTIDELRLSGARFPLVGDAVIPFYIRQAMGGTIAIEGVHPGTHTFCAAPITGPVKDPSELKLECLHYEVTAATRQQVKIVIPAKPAK